MENNKMRLVFSWVLRILLAAVFCLSALSKLSGIDHFELYIFSYGLLPLNLCYLAARLCIAAELVLALFILLGCYPRTTRLATLGILLLFTLFLCYAALVGRNDSCQCFGQWIHMAPMQSLLKNALLILLVLLYYRLLAPPTRKPRWWLVALLAAALTALPFVVSVPDNWMFGAQRLSYNEEVLAQSLEEEGALAAHGLGDGHRLVAFVTKGCPYCKMAREKLASIVNRHGLDSAHIVYLLPSDLPDGMFVGITYGSRPLLMLLDGKEVVATYHYRNIDEKQIASFLKTK